MTRYCGSLGVNYFYFALELFSCCIIMNGSIEIVLDNGEKIPVAISLDLFPTCIGEFRLYFKM